jgi:hypothetical protein
MIRIVPRSEFEISESSLREFCRRGIASFGARNSGGGSEDFGDGVPKSLGSEGLGGQESFVCWPLGLPEFGLGVVGVLVWRRLASPVVTKVARWPFLVVKGWGSLSRV